MTGSATILINPLPLDAQIIVGQASVCPGTLKTIYSFRPMHQLIAGLYIPMHPFFGIRNKRYHVLFAPTAASGNITVMGKMLVATRNSFSACNH
jgi:hypothetical protein